MAIGFKKNKREARRKALSVAVTGLAASIGVFRPLRVVVSRLRQVAAKKPRIIITNTGVIKLPPSKILSSKILKFLSRKGFIRRFAAAGGTARQSSTIRAGIASRRGVSIESLTSGRGLRGLGRR